MKVSHSGCAVCGSTWGDVWADVEGSRLFFCCAICVRQFRELVDRVEADSGWERIDSIEISGDRRGRIYTARRGTEAFRYVVVFNSEGAVLRFRSLPARRAGG